jgi:vacuolar-type H+-ATPase subunit H
LSQGIVRHLIHHEEAIDDVIEEYQQNGKTIIEGMARNHMDIREKTLEEAKALLKLFVDEHKESRLEVKRTEKELRASPVGSVGQTWISHQAELSGMITAGRRSVK